MSREELIATVGGPPGDYRTNPQRFSISHHSLPWVLESEEWFADDGRLTVTYDAQGRVDRWMVRSVEDTWRTALERLFRRPRIWGM
jgi:hypothetical protein